MDAEAWGIILGVVIFTVAATAGAWALANWAQGVSCRAKADAMSLEHRYSFWEECMIKAPDGRWVPLKNYRVL